ncbi:MAG: hypothetical protein IJD86_04855 [Clostridia bacterium]|nr:hypothetical protein [Clostridia bacterium]
MKGDGRMLKEDTVIAKASAERERCFYIRVKDHEFEAIEKIAKAVKREDGYVLSETIPVKTEEMHAMMKNMCGAFFAAIE